MAFSLPIAYPMPGTLLCRCLARSVKDIPGSRAAKSKIDSCVEGTRPFYFVSVIHAWFCQMLRPFLSLSGSLKRKTALGIASTVCPAISFLDHTALFKRIAFLGEYLERNER